LKILALPHHHSRELHDRCPLESVTRRESHIEEMRRRQRRIVVLDQRDFRREMRPVDGDDRREPGCAGFVERLPPLQRPRHLLVVGLTHLLDEPHLGCNGRQHRESGDHNGGGSGLEQRHRKHLTSKRRGRF
jgi:hypothetical protein